MPSNLFSPTEAISKSLKIIDPVHGVIHDGTHFTACHQVSVGTGTAVTVLIKTPLATTGKYIHFVANVESNKEITWELSEAPNASGGTALASNNNNRLTANTDPVVLTHTCTYTSSGTILESHTAGSGTGVPSVSKTGGGTEARNEWLLKPDTFYLVRAIAKNADTVINIVLPYYYRTV